MSRNRKGVLPRNSNSVYRRCNAFGLRTSECRNMHKPTPGYPNQSPFSASRNINYICYNCNGSGHRSNECMKKMTHAHGNQHNNYAQRRNPPARSRYQLKLIADYNGMTLRRRSNRSDRRSSNHPVGMNAIYFYGNISSHTIEPGKAKTY